MIFREGAIPKTPGQLKDTIGVAILSCSIRNFPNTSVNSIPYFDFEGIFYSMQGGVENLRKRLGDTIADQLVDMFAQAKAHHEEGWRLTLGKRPPKDRPNWWESKDVDLRRVVSQFL